MDEQKPNKPLGPAVGYVDMLDIATYNKSVEHAAKPNPRNPLRPSSAGKCAREKAYEFMEYKGYAKYEKEILTPETSRIFSLGHTIERDLLYNFRDITELHVKYQQQVLTFWPLCDGSLVEGSIDAVFVLPKWKCVIDCKSKKDKFSSYQITSWDETAEKLSKMKSVQIISDGTAYWVEDLSEFLKELRDPFFAANFLQLNLYACHEFMRERGIDHAAIIQYNKNDSRLREIRFKPSQALVDQVRLSDQGVAEVIERTKDPEQVDRSFMLGSIKCAFCSFNKHCWPSTNPTKEFFKSLPEKRDWPKDTDRLGALGKQLEELFSRYIPLKQAEKNIEVVEEEIAQILEKNSLYKIRLANKEIFEYRRLKNGFSIRRGRV